MLKKTVGILIICDDDVLFAAHAQGQNQLTGAEFTRWMEIIVRWKNVHRLAYL